MPKEAKGEQKGKTIATEIAALEKEVAELRRLVMLLIDKTPAKKIPMEERAQIALDRLKDKP